MNERWKALREHLMHESRDAWETFNKALENGEKQQADIFFTCAVAISNVIGAMDEIGEMTDEEVAEWRAKN